MATQSFTAELGDSNVERARDVGEGIAQALVSFFRRFQAWQARAAAAGGASCFGVATLQEGVELRQAGIEHPVLVLGNLTQPEELRTCLHWQLMPTLSGMREALLCQNLAAGSGRPMAVHLKLDTGMSRLGAPWQEGQRLVEAIAALEAVQLAGVYSHLADADAPGAGLDPLTRQQQQQFEAVLTGLQQAGLPSGARHLANSAATLRAYAEVIGNPNIAQS